VEYAGLVVELAGMLLTMVLSVMLYITLVPVSTQAKWQSALSPNALKAPTGATLTYAPRKITLASVEGWQWRIKRSTDADFEDVDGPTIELPAGVTSFTFYGYWTGTAIGTVPRTIQTP
jgi:hypothetical protein